MSAFFRANSVRIGGRPFVGKTGRLYPLYPYNQEGVPENMRSEHMPVERADGSFAATPPGLRQPVQADHIMALANLRQQLASIELERVCLALKESGGNQALAAQRLGMSRRSLVYRLTAIRIDAPAQTDVTRASPPGR